VPELNLTASSPLGGLEMQYAGVLLSEITDLALVSIAIPLGGRAALEREMAVRFNVGLPACGQSTVTTDGMYQFLGMQIDQLFALFEYSCNDAVSIISNELGKTAYYTDQTDSWAMLRIAGPMTRMALERICPLDLHPDRFSQGSVARTTMEHLAVIILRTDQDSFTLMSPRSSASSFLHAVETSIENVL